MNSPPHLAASTGLPESGYLQFSSDGSRIEGGVLDAKGELVSPDEALSFAGTINHLPNTERVLSHALMAPTDDTGLNFMDLVNMDQFMRDEKGGWYDALQQGSMEDFYNILKFNMPDELRKNFVSPNKPVLDATIKSIADTPGISGTSASDWYKSLSTAYLTGMLVNWNNDPAAKYLNGNRANKWLKKQTGISDVFSVQGPMLYANRWIKKFPDTQKFLDDQIINSDKYASLIDEDAAQWKKQMKAQIEGTGTQEQIDQLMKTLDDIAAKAKNRNYWTYVVFKYCTSPTFLNMLQVISFDPSGIDGSEFMRRVQRSAAVLNVLDPTSYFTQEFVYIVQIFQASNILPQLIDYSGNLEEYSYSVNEIIKAFIKTYINSPDPDMKEAAEAMQKLQEQGMMKDLLILFQQVAVAQGGLYSWGRMVANFQSRAAKLFGSLPKMAVMCIALAAVTFGILGFATGQLKWSDLTRDQQAAIIVSGVGILAQLVILVVRRGVAISTVFSPGSGFGAGFRLFFTRDLMTQAQQRTATGIRGWLIGEGSRPPTRVTTMEVEGNLALIEAEATGAEAREEVTFTRFLFGRNIDEFLATRFGAIAAVCGIIMSAIFLAQSHAPLEIAANSLFLAASCLELIATAGAWIVGGLNTTLVGGVLVSTLFPILGVIAIIAMVAGAILMIIFMTEKKPSPVENFAKDQAEKAGYYMPHSTEIDYFEVYQTDSTKPQLTGMALLANGIPLTCLRMAVDGSLSLGSIDHTASTTFYLIVDEIGRAKFVAPLVKDGKPAAKVLTLNDSGQLVAADSISDPDKISQQLWRAEMLGNATLESGHLNSAPFAFYNEYYSSKNKGAKKYLGVSGSSVVPGDSQQIWLAQMVVTAPAGLKMNDLSLYTYNKDVSQSPSLNMPGSEPRTWSISPKLPDFIGFDASCGRVFQKAGVVPTVMAKTQYTLNVSNQIGSVSTTFNITVNEPPVKPALAVNVPQVNLGFEINVPRVNPAF